MKKLLKPSALIVVMLLSFLTFTSKAQTGTDLMKMIATEMNKSCPMDCGDGLLITKVSYANSYLVFELTNNESYVKMTDIIANRTLFKDTMLETLAESFSDPDLAALLINTKTGFKFNIKGTKSGKTCLISVSSQELTDAL